MNMRTKLLLPSVAVSAVLVGYLLLIWLPRANSHAESVYHESVMRHLHSVAIGLAPILNANKMTKLNGTLDGLLENNPEWKFIELFDDHGDRIYPLNRPMLPHQDISGQGHYQSLRQPVVLQDKHLADMVVQVDFRSALAAVKSDQRQIAIVIIVTLGAVLALLWRRIGAQVQRPLEELTHFTSALAQGNTKAAAPVTSADEMGILAARMSTLRDLMAQHQTQLMHESNQRQQAEQTLLERIEALASLQGETFYRILVKNFATILGVRDAFIAECLNFPTTRVRALAFWYKGDYLEDVEFDLAGTPCEEVINEGKTFYYPRNIGDRFPVEKQYERESYLGFPLFDSSGHVMGHIACFDDKPMRSELPPHAIMKIFAARAASELERTLTQRALDKEKQRSNALIHTVPEAVISTDATGGIEYLNTTAERLTGWDNNEAKGLPLNLVFRTHSDYVAGGETDSNTAAQVCEIQASATTLLIHRLGHSLPITHTSTPLRGPQGEIRGMVVVFREFAKPS